MSVATANSGHSSHRGGAPRLILASASPRRRELLSRAGLDFELRSADVEERWAAPEHPVAHTRRLALAKATAVANAASDALVLGADTTVWSDPAAGPIGKPRDAGEARAILEALLACGRHAVTTAFAWVGPDGTSHEVHHVTATVDFRPVSSRELDRYLARDDWRDKAGGYGIQSDAEGWVRAVGGSYTAVVGLPLAEVILSLARRAPELAP